MNPISLQHPNKLNEINYFFQQYKILSGVLFNKLKFGIYIRTLNSLSPVMYLIWELSVDENS
jgi:hypothetical protein